MNYQYRFGNTFTGSAKLLYEDGGYGRYYQGMTAALFQGKLSSHCESTMSDLSSRTHGTLW